jgi:uncharacterized protein (TIGR02246 family)
MGNLVSIVGLSALAAFPLQERGGPPRPAPTRPAEAVASRPGPSDDEKAIRAADEAFVRDYNKGDSKSLAAMFTEGAEVVEADGIRYEGRDLVEKSLAESFAEDKGARIALEVESIRFLTRDVAKEEGRSVVTPTAGAPTSRLYTALYVRREGRWLIASVREEPDPMVRPHDRLRDLEWMVGDWVDEGSDAEVRLNCRWSEDGNFLFRSFTVKLQGKPVMSVNQRIGWDPLARQIRSWEFDSEGGFGEGRWSREGDRWVVKHTGVRPEGVTASATNVMIREKPDLVRWVSTDRVFGDTAETEVQSYVLARVAPPPGIRPKTPSPTSPTPKTERSPR